MPSEVSQLFAKGFLFVEKELFAIVAMSSDGVEAYELSVGSANSSTFFDFVRGSLIPVMQPFSDKHSIMVVDITAQFTTDRK